MKVSDPYFLAYNVKPEHGRKVATLVGFKWFRFDIFLNITIEAGSTPESSIFHITKGSDSGTFGTRYPALMYFETELCVYFDFYAHELNKRICSGNFEEDQPTIVKIRCFQEPSVDSNAGYLNFEFCVNEACQMHRWYHSSVQVFYWFYWSELYLYLSDPWYPTAKSIIHSFGVNIGKYSSKFFTYATYSFIIFSDPSVTLFPLKQEYAASCFEENIDYPGGDIHSDLKYSSGPEECQQLCQANDKCLYWGFKGGSKLCWLKSKKISRSSNSGTISGPKNCQEIYQDVNSAAIQYPKDMRSKIFTSKALQILGEKKISHEIFTRVLPKLKRSELSLHYQCGSKDKDSLVEVI